MSNNPATRWDAHPLIPLQQYRIWQWVNTVMEQPKMATSKTKIMFGAAGFRFHMVSWKKTECNPNKKMVDHPL
jgi:hypothetical protein